jgi:hypothetical protein
MRSLASGSTPWAQLAERGAPVSAVELRPRAVLPGWYDRRIFERVRLAVDGGHLVAVDTSGRRHRLPAGEPATICIRLHTGAGRNGITLAVLGRDSAILVIDDSASVWSADDVERFAHRAGLHWPEHGVATSTRYPGTPVRLHTLGRRGIAMFAVPGVGGAVIGVGLGVGWPLLVVAAIAAGCVAAVALLVRGGRVRIDAVPDGRP